MFVIKFKVKNTAFTLAEVLITLGIIGIVAALTIPHLVQNSQDNEFKNKMKKEYSVLAQAQQQIIAENGGDFLSALMPYNPTLRYSAIKLALQQKLSYIIERDFLSSATTSPCFSSGINYLDGTSAAADTMVTGALQGACLVLKDGATLAFHVDNGASGAASFCDATRGTYTNECGWIVIDVNGLKPPNQWGRDIYVFYIFSDTIRPNSTQLNYFHDDCSTTGTYTSGRTCASKYLLGIDSH